MVELMRETAAIAPDTVRPLLRVHYEKLVELGAFGDERVELLCGQLVTLGPQGGAHAMITAWLTRELILALDRDYDVRAHSPYAATEDSEPQPDISVSRWSYVRRHHPSDAALVVEVSDSSLRKDRGVKAAIYARNGAPEYWVVDLARALVEVHTRPANGRYTHVEVRGPADVLRPGQLPQVGIAVGSIPWPLGRD